MKECGMRNATYNSLYLFTAHRSLFTVFNLGPVDCGTEKGIWENRRTENEKWKRENEIMEKGIWSEKIECEGREEGKY